MIVHAVLFRPRPDLTAEQRASLVDAFSAALREISVIRRSSVGERITHGRGYERLMRTNYSHAAFLEFDDVAGLRAYLEHPAHERLGQLFFETFEEALMYDFETKDGLEGVETLAHAHGA